MFIKCHYIYLFLILAGGECLVQSPEDIATSYECQFFNLSVFSVWSIYIVILGLMKLFFEQRYHWKRSKFNHIFTSLE